MLPTFPCRGNFTSFFLTALQAFFYDVFYLCLNGRIPKMYQFFSFRPIFDQVVCKFYIYCVFTILQAYLFPSNYCFIIMSIAYTIFPHVFFESFQNSPVLTEGSEKKTDDQVYRKIHRHHFKTHDQAH